VPACVPDSTGADAVLSRHRLHSMGTMETAVVRFGVGSWSVILASIIEKQISNGVVY